MRLLLWLFILLLPFIPPRNALHVILSLVHYYYILIPPMWLKAKGRSESAVSFSFCVTTSMWSPSLSLASVIRDFPLAFLPPPPFFFRVSTGGWLVAASALVCVPLLLGLLALKSKDVISTYIISSASSVFRSNCAAMEYGVGYYTYDR
jgi:hypothetical protein